MADPQSGFKMKKTVIRICVVLLLGVSLHGVVSARSRHLVGNFIAYDVMSGGICVCFCEARFIFKVEKPSQNSPEYISVILWSSTSDFEKHVNKFLTADRVKIKVNGYDPIGPFKVEEFVRIIDEETRKPLPSNIKRWQLVGTSQYKGLPFEQTLSSFFISEYPRVLKIENK